MPAIILASTGLLVFAALVLLIGSRSITLAAFLSLPVLQQIAWVVVGLVPLAITGIALFQTSRLMQKRKVAKALETHLRNIHLGVKNLEEVQTGTDLAMEYLDGSDPERAIGAVQTRLSGTEEAMQFHAQRNQSSDLLGAIEKTRQHQEQIRQKLGDVTAKRRSIETSIAQLEGVQGEMEGMIAALEQDKEGGTLERRLQKLSQFVGLTNTRCAEIEQSMRNLLELEEKFALLQRRIAPMHDKGTGVVSLLDALSDMRSRLHATVAGLERHEDISLAERIQELTRTRGELEERVSSLLAQFSEIDAMHKDISGLFLKLNQLRRMPLDAGTRVVASNANGNGHANGNGMDATQQDERALPAM
jgi:predicted  nucleic acid-binding Zn-ribbon protein